MPTLNQFHLLVQARRLSLFGHIARMPDETCQEYHNCFPFGGLEETTRTSSNYVDEYYSARPEIKQSFTGWGDNCGSESSILETDVCVWRYAPLVVHATQQEEGHSDTQSWASECPGVKNYGLNRTRTGCSKLYSCTHTAIVGVKGLKIDVLNF